ncbi:putative efflux protein, MATE family [Treponema bryantii]|uniref:Multidrug export protein MepA n=1 Tax=Treponema bryantii TaxID=163 RepID=A0A1H9H2L9_9SPIR|nr:MATE family efflux transporter [Treponema bryantii]SEQ56614.1 putative efflux protein, MATE family [Treponema bryantii]
MKPQNLTAEEQYNKMVNTPVSRLITSLAVPTVISMLVTAIYNMADTFFVSHINTQASAAVGIVFPIMSIIQAVGFTLGMGSGSLVSIRLGQKRNEEASIIASTALFTALGVGALITIFGNLFAPQVLSLVGASESVLPYAQQYGRFIFWGAPLMCASFVLNNVLRSEGKAFFSMIALTSGGLINIALDPLFIYGFGMGISGAAVATIVSQTISFVILLSWFLRGKAVCHMSIKLFRGTVDVLGKTVATGVPSLARQGLASVATILLNTTAGAYGDSAVAAMSITTKIVMFVAAIMIGIGQGFSPVSGYNYGAKRYDRVKKAYRFLVGSGFAIMACFAIVIFIFANQIMHGFIKDEAAVAVGVVALRWQIAFIPFHPLIVGTNMLMQSTRHIKAATFLSMNRQGVYFIPAILILPRLFGLRGVETSQAAADILSAFTAIPYLIHMFRKLDRLAKENEVARS